ncbi:nuclear transport factor 2 family protein [Sphingobium sp. AN558]|uniref:nuclear transport factor 2 family protein n=1 Tax=Sphingobium sp. AN558 TaxID=3133442 RepID=UPI0030BC97F7
MPETDEAPILRLATELDQSVDRKDWPTLRSFFVDRLAVEVGIVAGDGASMMDADAFVAEVAAFNPPRKIACHSFLNPLVHVTGDRAQFTANRYGWNLCDGFDPPLFETWGRIAYGLIRTGDGWLIDRFRLEVLREAGNRDVSRLREG